MPVTRYKIYLASGIKLWRQNFKDEYSPFFNKKLDLFQPALIDEDYSDQRKIPIRIATKDLGEINKCNAILAYMKMYDTENNGAAGTDSTWECGYAIGKEKPTIMLVENLEHLDYYSAQWMVTFSIGAILTTSKEVSEFAKNNDKFTHTAVLYCENKDQFENKIIEYLDKYYKSIYAREGIINYSVDKELRHYADISVVAKILEKSGEYADYNKYALNTKVFENSKTKFDVPFTYRQICNLEYERAKIVKQIIEEDFNSLVPFLYHSISKYLSYFEGKKNIKDISGMIAYWFNIPAQEIQGRKQGKKKTRPTIFFELYDLVSHHIIASQKYFHESFVYQMGAILEIYNWLNTYAIDDVFDDSDSRQGEKTLHKKFGSRKNAFLLGAIGHCLSLVLLYELTRDKEEPSKQLLSALNDVQYIMYLGQPIDIDLTFTNNKDLLGFIQENNLESALKKYFNRIYGICGAFYEEIGRMAVKSTNVGAQFYNKKETESACIYISKIFGLVQMIRNDLGDLIFPEQMSDLSKGMKSTSHNDIAEGKLTLPIIYTIFNPGVNLKDKQTIIKFIGKNKLTLQDKHEISRITWESGSIEYSIQFVEYYSKLVRDQYIKYIDETPTRLKWILKLMDITPLINITFRKTAIENRWRKLEPQILTEQLISEINKITDRENFLANYDR
ncbi:MAG: polyprenyl synthetase family protein [Patescibacteria group bacterium]